MKLPPGNKLQPQCIFAQESNVFLFVNQSYALHWAKEVLGCLLLPVPCWFALAQRGLTSQCCLLSPQLSPAQSIRNGSRSILECFNVDLKKTCILLLTICVIENFISTIILFLKTSPTAYGSSQGQGLNRSCSCQPTPQPWQHQI